jgi:integral membrane protein (TIGR01906 family)
MISSLALFLLFVLLPVIFLANSQFYFANAFARYDVWQEFSASDRESAWQNFQVLMSKLNPPFSDLQEGYMPQAFFGERDLAHMQDVQNLFKWIWGGVVIAAIALLALVRQVDKRQMLKYTLRAMIAVGLLLGVAAIGAILDWETTFVIFHRLVFTENDYWQLDPSSSNLIKYFLNPIFFELFITYFLLEALILLVLKNSYDRITS